MLITTPTQVQQVAWQGKLVQAVGVFRGVITSPTATLGEPVVWKMDALQAQVGKAWTPPADGRLYALVRIDFTLHPLEDSSARYEEAQLRVFLRPRAGEQRRNRARPLSNAGHGRKIGQGECESQTRIEICSWD